MQQGGGGLKRLSVAVVVNHRKTVDKNGKVGSKPLSTAEMAQITDLVKEAMGYNQQRGDTLNVVNSPFAIPEVEAIPETPMWKQPGNIQLAKDSGKYLLMGVALLLLYLRMLKPMLKKLSEPAALPAPGQAGGHPQLAGANGEMLALANGNRTHQDNLTRAQQLAKDDPRVVANIVKTWVSE